MNLLFRSNFTTDMKGKALLLYSGGLDTSVMIKWLQEIMNYDVSTLTLDVGQEKNNLKEIAQKAKKIGASETITRDVTDIFAEKYIAQAFRQRNKYNAAYFLFQ